MTNKHVIYIHYNGYMSKMLAYISNTISTVINFAPSEANVTRLLVKHCVENKCIDTLHRYINIITPKDIIDIALDAKEFIYLTLVPDCQHYLPYLDHIDFADNLPKILPLLRVNNEFIIRLFNDCCYFVDVDNIHYLCRMYKDIISSSDPLSHACYYYYMRVNNIIARYFTANISHINLWQELGLSIKYLLFYNPRLLIPYTLSYIKLWSS